MDYRKTFVKPYKRQLGWDIFFLMKNYLKLLDCWTVRIIVFVHPMNSTIKTTLKIRYGFGWCYEIGENISWFRKWTELQKADGTPSNRMAPVLIMQIQSWNILELIVPDYIPPKMWPPNSPGLSPCDYNSGSSLEQRVLCGVKFRMLNTLKIDSRGVGWTFRKEVVNRHTKIKEP